MKILVVEDESTLRSTIVDFLEEEGYTCEQSGTLKRVKHNIRFINNL